MRDMKDILTGMLNILVPLCIGIILAILLITLIGCEQEKPENSMWKEMEPGTEMMSFQLDDKTIWCMKYAPCSSCGYGHTISCVMIYGGNYAIVPKEDIGERE